MIPAFFEQSDVATSCPLDLPYALFLRIRNTCGGEGGQQLMGRSKCCPILAAWIYSAYSSTTLGNSRISGGTSTSSSTPYDLPVLPDDSKMCVYKLEEALKSRWIELRKPNETCGVLYCYCGIRLHPFSCPSQAGISVSKKEKEIVLRRSLRQIATTMPMPMPAPNA